MIDQEYFERVKQQLGFERADQLSAAQTWLDERYGVGTMYAKMLHQGSLRVVTASAPAAGDLRMRQLDFLAAVGLSDVRLVVTIG